MELTLVPLNPTQRCLDALEFESGLRGKVIGQAEAIAIAADMVQTVLAGLNDPTKPAGIMLCLGPTGTGRTRLAEALALGPFLAGHTLHLARGRPAGWSWLSSSIARRVHGRGRLVIADRRSGCRGFESLSANAMVTAQSSVRSHGVLLIVVEKADGVSDRGSAI